MTRSSQFIQRNIDGGSLKRFYYAAGIVVAVVALVTLYLLIDRHQEPDLQVTVDCENWQAHPRIENGQNSKPTVEIFGEVLNFYDGDYIKDVQQAKQDLKSMHTILIENKGSRISKKIVLRAQEDYKFNYLVYKEENDEQLRGIKDKLYVNLAPLRPQEAVIARAWMDCPVCTTTPAIRVMQNTDNTNIYLRTPVVGYTIRWASTYSWGGILLITITASILIGCKCRKC